MSTLVQGQHAKLPPAQPTYVLRGHVAQIHSVCFLRSNSRLLTGDADGWVVLWSVATKRATAVWKAHQGAILGLDSWTDDKIITHGRDNKLQVWQLAESDEKNLSIVLPIDDANSHRKEPWLLHTLHVNTLNFCSFAKCAAGGSSLGFATSDDKHCGNAILIAVPGPSEGSIVIHRLPEEAAVSVISVPKAVKTGMVMAVHVSHVADSLHVIVGYESGHAYVWRQTGSSDSQWQSVYTSQVHTQPILSLAVSPSSDAFFTSSADAVIAQHPLPLAQLQNQVVGRQAQTKHSGQQSLKVRSDGRILATAGWDGRMRVYSCKTLRELAVLKWHKEGCYALAFASLDPPKVASYGVSVSEDDNNDKATQVTTFTHETVAQRRDARAQTTHWLAAGAKDGKVSLWDIY